MFYATLPLWKHAGRTHSISDRNPCSFCCPKRCCFRQKKINITTSNNITCRASLATCPACATLYLLTIYCIRLPLDSHPSGWESADYYLPAAKQVAGWCHVDQSGILCCPATVKPGRAMCAPAKSGRPPEAFRFGPRG